MDALPFETFGRVNESEARTLRLVKKEPLEVRTLLPLACALLAFLCGAFPLDVRGSSRGFRHGARQHHRTLLGMGQVRVRVNLLPQRPGMAAFRPL
jgi:hypothetical protein